MTNILCLNKDELLKSNLIVFNNLDFFAILKIVFKFNDKNKFKYVIINKPKIKIYKFLTGIGYKIRLFDWNLNSKDASNNLAKITVEFGLFSVFLFIYFIYFAFSKKATLEEKSFLIPLVLTQLMRGAGYYNGGFLICIILICIIIRLNFS